jgi:hypothetical protein
MKNITGGFSMRILFLCLLIVSCNQQKRDPKDIVRDFVKASFDNSIPSEGLKSFLTEDFYVNITKDLEFNKQKSSAKLVSYADVQNSCTEASCSVMYIVIFDQLDVDKNSRVEVKKQAQLTKVGESWLIADVQNIKTFIDVKDPIGIQGN